MISRDLFGRLNDGRSVWKYTLTNRHGMEADLIDFGAAVTAVRVPDRSGIFADVVRGYDSLPSYVKNPYYMGVTVGRYANRIRGGAFELEGRRYQLECNHGGHHLHGGCAGLSHLLWQSSEESENNAVVFSCVSPDGAGGYPGELRVTLRYALTDRNELQIFYEASTGAPTVINLTNHSYFNLAAGGDILGHELMLAADFFAPVDRDVIPTGEIRSVEGTPFDFREPRRIGERIDTDDEQLLLAGGYDHNWVLNPAVTAEDTAARLRDPGTGRVLEVLTSEPGIQCYSGNFLEAGLPGKQGRVHAARSAVCLETQHFPDSPNHPHFPSTVLVPGETFRSRTVFRFLTD